MEKKSMEIKKETILICNFKRALSLATLSFFLIFSPMYAYSQNSSQSSSQNSSQNSSQIFSKLHKAQISQNSSQSSSQNSSQNSLQPEDNETENDRSSIRIRDILFTEGKRTRFQSRILNILIRSQITTMDQLTKKSRAEILKLHNMGEQKVKILEEELKKKNYSLSLPSTPSNLLEGIFFTEHRTAIQKRILNALRSEDITTIDQLMEMTVWELSNLAYMGEQKIKILIEEMESKGYSLSSSSVPPVNSNLIEDIFFTEEGSRTAIQKKIMNALRSEDITTIDQLMEMTVWEIENIPNMGVESRRVLTEGLERKGYLFLPPTELEGKFFTEGNRTSIQIRVLNVLRWNDITTIAQLESQTEEELSKLPRMRIDIMRALIKEVESKGYSLSLPLTPPSHQLKNILFKGYPTVIQTRILNVLRRNNITTLDQLLEMSEKKLSNIPNIGEESLRVLQEAIQKVLIKEVESKGYSLSLLSTPSHQLKDILFKEYPTVIQTRILNVLRRNNITTFDQLLEMSEEQLSNIPNMGAESLIVLQKAIQKVLQEVIEKEQKSKCNKSFESIQKN